ncbi:hypothetical protein Cl131_gp148 [Aphanizomenon phage vB_AphaS-CL131]|nr:hypothetical protein Cl131_gp148 [Aphanizomenon phage vB_AphaS-CL131]
MADYISVTDTAKIVRGELKKHFPGVVFSVRSSSYSMGASIDISWTDGPIAKAVEAITGQFEGSSFDSMQDMKISRRGTWEGREVRWGSDYVTPTRKYSKQFYRQVAERICKEYSVPIPEIKQSSYEYRGKTEFGNPYIEDSHIRISGYDTLSDLINRELAETPATANVPQNLGSSNINGITVTVTENTAEDGIEVRFSDKPPEEIIQSIGRYGAGFKYSRRQNIWYAKRTDAKLAFAKSLVEKFNQPQDEPDLTDDDTDIFLAAMQAIAEVNELLATLGM